jgi:hypothetical protein
LAPFLSRIDGEIDGVASELKVCQWRKRERAGRWREEVNVGENREKYKYPLLTTVT